MAIQLSESTEATVFDEIIRTYQDYQRRKFYQVLEGKLFMPPTSTTTLPGLTLDLTRILGS